MAPEPSGDDVVEAAARQLAERGEPFVRATVVRREPAVSANVGDRAVVTADGAIHGWIGGVECAQQAVAREARRALETGRPRFVGLAPDPATVDRPGLEAFPMTCHGGGTLEVFLEPVGPGAALLVVGTSAVADAVGRFADAVGFAVTVADPTGQERPAHAMAVVEAVDAAALAEGFDRPPFVVVASMGEADAEGVAAAVELDAPYVGLVASETRAADVVDRAADRLGVEPAHVREALTVPAGVDIDARTPAEIALSVVAQLVQVRHAAGATVDVEALPPEPETVRDPVCGMDVRVDAPAATVDHAGETYYFCSTGCAESFRADPERYLADV